MSIKEEKEALRTHGVRWRLRGLPIFESPCSSVVIGYTSEEQWKWEDITDAQQHELKKYADKEYKRSLSMKYGITEDESLYYACCDYGVSCPHKWKFHEPVYKECLRCKASQPLPGKVVWIGDQPLRFETKPPLYLKIPRKPKPQYLPFNPDELKPNVMTTVEYDEYYWVYDHYEKVD